MNIIISNHDKEPLYEQIKNQIIVAIFNEILVEGEQLVSIRTLAKELGVGVITVKRAYDDLVTNNFLISIEARGYYVNKISKDKIKDIALSLFKKNLSLLLNDTKKYQLSKNDLNRIWEETLNE